MLQCFGRRYETSIWPFKASEFHFFVENTLPLAPPATAQSRAALHNHRGGSHVLRVLQRPEELVYVPLCLVRNTDTELARGVEMEYAGGT